MHLLVSLRNSCASACDRRNTMGRADERRRGIYTIFQRMYAHVACIPCLRDSCVLHASLLRATNQKNLAVHKKVFSHTYTDFSYITHNRSLSYYFLLLSFLISFLFLLAFPFFSLSHKKSPTLTNLFSYEDVYP